MLIQDAGKKEKKLIDKLSHGLSEAELRRVLGSALTTLDKPKLEHLCAKLGPDTGPALRRILRSSAKYSPPRHSCDKVRQEWKQAWSQWDSHISDACLEDGPYVIQEHHWEEPYFDPEAVASDLEPIAAKMRKLLPRVFDDGLDPTLRFSASIKETVEDIADGLPEWMNPFDGNGFGLGPQATGCLLDWEWRVIKKADGTAFQLLDDMRRLESSIDGLYLDAETIVGFISSLDAKTRKEIQSGIHSNRQKDHWSKTLDSAYSPWFRMYTDLCSEFNRESYLENCQTKINQDWRLALPVIQNLRRGKEHSKVAEISSLALRSYLHLRTEEKWAPEENLINSFGDRLYEEKSVSRLVQILGAWNKSAKALGHDETAAALQLQSDLLETGRNWDKVFAAFRREPLARFSRTRNRLYEKWRDRTAEESLSNMYFHDIAEQAGLERPKSSHWIHALLDSVWTACLSGTGLPGEGPDGSAAFAKWVRGWFREMDDRPETLAKNMKALARFTLDLDSACWLREECPALARVLAGSGYENPALRASRRGWLEHSGALSLMPELLDFWRRHTEALVPDPHKTGSSNYDNCADWVRALHEINPKACRNLLARWETPHRRRKNLWLALRKRGLPPKGVSRR